MTGRRNTLQKSAVLNALKRLEHATAEEVLDELRKTDEGFSLATAYRNLRLFLSEGVVSSFLNAHGAQVFDITANAHYHLICDCCKKVFDLPVSYQKELDEKYSKALDADIKCHSASFFGICTNCRKEA